jgi:hypothetical protein
VFNTTFKHISVTTFGAEIGVPRENRTEKRLSHNVLSSTPIVILTWNNVRLKKDEFVL